MSSDLSNSGRPYRSSMSNVRLLHQVSPNLPRLGTNIGFRPQISHLYIESARNETAFTLLTNSTQKPRITKRHILQTSSLTHHDALTYNPQASRILPLPNKAGEVISYTFRNTMLCPDHSRPFPFPTRFIPPLTTHSPPHHPLKYFKPFNIRVYPLSPSTSPSMNN